MITLYIRSYDKDIPWLQYSIRSMIKNLSGIDTTVLNVPRDTILPKDVVSFFDKIVTTDEVLTGYLQQQVDKVRAYKHTDDNYILYSDSDCIYYNPVDAKQFLIDDKVLLYYTNYTDLEGNVLNWKEITYLSTGLIPEREYMRCFPIMHHRETCEILDNLPHWNNYLTQIKGHSLSEFNALGIIADTHTNYYELRNTHTSPILPMAKQYWSWGGFTPEILEELNQI